jgi:hypothetical protein
LGIFKLIKNNKALDAGNTVGRVFIAVILYFEFYILDWPRRWPYFLSNGLLGMRSHSKYKIQNTK